MRNAAFCVLLVLASCIFTLGQTYKKLWVFGGTPTDGSNPVSALVFDKAGNIYGTTEYGGSADRGTIFELSPSSDGTWKETVLYSFCIAGGTCPDGDAPDAGLVFDAAGNLYGTTIAGGSAPMCPAANGCGTVFELSPPSGSGAWAETVLYDFCSLGGSTCTDGESPTSRLIFDPLGNLYGTTILGGTGGGGSGAGKNGVVFELSPAGSQGWTESVLYNFCSEGTTCPDGTDPVAGVTSDDFGNLYGAAGGGSTTTIKAMGTLYRLSPGPNGWTETVLYAFRGPHYNDGELPAGTVSIVGPNLYTTTSVKGPYGDGTVLRMDLKSGRVSVFGFDGSDGANPVAGVLVDPLSGGHLYGTASGAGVVRNGGSVFQIDAAGQETVLYNFCSQKNCTDGERPSATLVMDALGNLYGTTERGGIKNGGVVFEITP
jgi:uncharacterized repeat protein (TIGR03803 family)